MYVELREIEAGKWKVMSP